MPQPIEKLVLALSTLLKAKQLKLVTAESCTAGGLSYWLTTLPGSSAWFERGFVVYSNDAKVEMLGVQPSTLEKQGAVSEATVREMAKGALQHSKADLSIAITGIAGPDGGRHEKPVGTVWIAWAGKSFGPYVEMNVFSGDRESVRIQCIEKAMVKLIEILEDE